MDAWYRKRRLFGRQNCVSFYSHFFVLKSRHRICFWSNKVHRIQENNRIIRLFRRQKTHINIYVYIFPFPFFLGWKWRQKIYFWSNQMNNTWCLFHFIIHTVFLRPINLGSKLNNQLIILVISIYNGEYGNSWYNFEIKTIGNLILSYQLIKVI